MKIVLDTNVFISGVFWKGPPHAILELWAQDKFHMLVTEKILEEYFRIFQKMDPEDKVTPHWRLFIPEHSSILKDQDFVTLCRDPDDNKFLNCAIAGSADYIISGDDDLLSLKKIGSTTIVTPNQFLKMEDLF